MTNKIILVFVAMMLALNFFAWNAVTVKNDKNIKEIYRILESCENK
jgi:hypothetical protein